MTPLKHVNLIFLLGLLFSLACAGCVSKNSTQQAETEVEAPMEYPGAVYEQGDEASPAGYYIHTVKLPDESVSIIAKWFTGDLMNWEMLAKANPTINPNRIFMGDKIKIPRDSMTTHSPMTPEFVEASQPQKRRKKVADPTLATAEQIKAEPASLTAQATPEPAAEPVLEDEALLFGPKGYSKN